MRKNLRLIPLITLFPLITLLLIQSNLFAANAEWTILVYMQADNNLSEYADKDMMAMLSGYQKAVLNSAFNVNLLTQVDLPHPQGKKTWRFKIDKSGKIEHDSLNQDMGDHPAKALIESAAWINEKYPANHYAIILWNHGSGVEDYRKINFGKSENFNSAWMDIFDTSVLVNDKNKKTANKINLKKNQANHNHANQALGELSKHGREMCEPEMLRGILYDDSEKTCLTNQGLSYALSQIKNILGKRIDLVGMDACLMAMVEVAYEIKDYANILVASQETEPGYGWDYLGIIAPLVSDPGSFAPENLAKLVVTAYGRYYSTTDMQSYTQSAINLNLLDPLCANIEAIAVNILACLKCKPSIVKKALHTARLNSKSFEMASYVDLCSLYCAFREVFTRLRHDAENEKPSCCGLINRPCPAYTAALDQLIQHLNEGIGFIEHVAFANVFGARSNGAHGISIYYPFSGSAIHPSYPNTIFARNTHWLSMLSSI